MWGADLCETICYQIEFLKSQGVTWNEVDIDAFSKACEPVIDWIVETLRRPTYEAYDQLKASSPSTAQTTTHKLLLLASAQ